MTEGEKSINSHKIMSTEVSLHLWTVILILIELEIFMYNILHNFCQASVTVTAYQAHFNWLSALH